MKKNLCALIALAATAVSAKDIAFPDKKQVLAVHYAELVNVELARPINPVEVFMQMPSTLASVSDHEAKMRLLDAIYALPMRGKNANPDAETVRNACLSIPNLTQTLAIEQERYRWIFMSGSCMQVVQMADTCRTMGTAAAENCFADGKVEAVMTYSIPSAAWEALMAKLPGMFFPLQGAKE